MSHSGSAGPTSASVTASPAGRRRAGEAASVATGEGGFIASPPSARVPFRSPHRLWQTIVATPSTLGRWGPMVVRGITKR